MLGEPAELLQRGADTWCGFEAGSWEGVDGEAEAVALAGAERAVVQPVRVEGFLPEGGVDGWWHLSLRCGV